LRMIGPFAGGERHTGCFSYRAANPITLTV
jgi:hypothetical protein